MTNNTYPRTFSHIGISVPDVEQAVEFYSQVMGWYPIMKPTVITEESETAIGVMCIDVFGTGWGSFKIAHMSTGDRIGVEMFEFPHNESPKEFDYWKTSTFHFCVQDPDSKDWSPRSSSTAVNNACRSASIIRARNPIACATWKTPLA